MLDNSSFNVEVVLPVEKTATYGVHEVFLNETQNEYALF